jgi:arylsulfatase A-like enzyme
MRPRNRPLRGLSRSPSAPRPQEPPAHRAGPRSGALEPRPARAFGAPTCARDVKQACYTLAAMRTSSILVLGLATLLAGCGEESPTVESPSAENIVIFTVDTLRADHIGAYGNEAVSTPNADRLAREGVLFEHAYTQATLTHPALSSMLTGLLPRNNGVTSQPGRLREGVVPLQEQLRSLGMATGSFVAHVCAQQDVERTVFHDGWDTRFCGVPSADGDRGAAASAQDLEDHFLWDQRCVEAALEWIAEQEGPYLCWIHLKDPHAAHRPDPAFWDYEADPPREWLDQYRHYGDYERRREFPEPEEQARLMALYRAEVASSDMLFGRVLDAVDAERTAVVFTADHGEELYDSWSRYDHGGSLTDAVLHVPLIVRAPGLSPRVETDVVELLQVTPTVLDLFNLEPVHPVEGASLLDEVPSRGFAISSYLGVTATLRNEHHRYWVREIDHPYRQSIVAYPWRADAPWFDEPRCIAEYPDPNSNELLWLSLEDPLVADLAARYEQGLMSFVASYQGGSAPTELSSDPELLRALRAMGYTESELGSE